MKEYDLFGYQVEIDESATNYKITMSEIELMNKWISVFGAGVDGEDSEQEALSKLKCRIKTCQIAKELYIKGIEAEAISQWKFISV